MDALLVGVGERIAPVAKGAAAPLTFAKFAATWSGGELARDYPDHVGKKKSARDAGYRLDILGDVIGDVPLASFTLDHADEAMRRLDEIRRKRAGRDVKPLDVGGGASTRSSSRAR